MPVITACSTLAFSLSNLETALKHISGYGFAKVEISDQVTHSKHFQEDSVDPHEVKKLLEKYSLKPVCANVAICIVHDEIVHTLVRPAGSLSSAETDEIQKAKQYLSFHKFHIPEDVQDFHRRVVTLIDNAAIAGIPQVCVHTGRRLDVENLDAEIIGAAKAIDRAAEYARSKNIRVLVEMPHVWNLYSDMEKTMRIFSLLTSDNAGVLIDSTHWHTSGYNLEKYVSVLGDRLWHIHLRDAAGKDGGRQSYELEKTPGRGEVDFAFLGEILDKYGYHGEVTLETEYKNYRDPGEVDSENLFALEYLKTAGWEVSLG
ncbi:MAG: hypothetical protein DRP60_01295 [Spirochaetes bacterium]|nr:MAG: hypothetical protein DRP60_01295 [Spirochaetota bacterium]